MQDEVRGKRVYTITDAGRAAVHRRARDAPVEPPVPMGRKKPKTA